MIEREGMHIIPIISEVKTPLLQQEWTLGVKFFLMMLQPELMGITANINQRRGLN